MLVANSQLEIKVGAITKTGMYHDKLACLPTVKAMKLFFQEAQMKPKQLIKKMAQEGISVWGKAG